MNTTKRVELQQLFYGRTRFGYKVLGGTMTEGAAVSNAVSLCGSFGSPPAAGLASSVLMSAERGGYRYMICIFNGDKDPTGRATLFFHILFAKQTDVEKSGKTAFDLHREGLFKSEVSEGARPDVLNVACVPPHPTDKPAMNFPAAIIVKDTSADALGKALGGAANRCSWVSYSEHDIKGVDVIGLSPSAMRPSERWIYDADLRLLRASANNVDNPSERRVQEITVPREKKDGKLLLRISLILNVVFIVVFLHVMSSSPSVGNHTKVAALEEKVASLADECNSLRSENKELKQVSSRTATMEPLLGELARSFPEEAFVELDEVSKGGEERYKPIWPVTEGWHDGAHERLRASHDLYLKWQKYVDFVNTKILKTNKKGNAQ